MLKRLRPSHLIFFSMCVYLCIFLLPALQTNAVFVNAFLTLCFLTFIIGVLFRGHISAGMIAAFLLWTLFSWLIYQTQWSDKYSLANKMLMLAEFWLPSFYAMTLDDVSASRGDTQKKLVSLTLILYSCTCLTTIWGNLKYEIPSRYLATSIIDPALKIQYRSENIGGYGFCYLSIFMVPLIILALKRTKNRLLYIPLALSYVCAVESQYTILLLLLALVTFWTLFNRLRVRTKLLLILAFSLAAFGFFLNMDSIFAFVLNLLQDKPYLQERIGGIYALLTGYGNQGDDVQSRQEVYWKSINLFLHNPLIGGGFGSKVGLHSEILDLLGSMGLFGLCLLSAILMAIWSDVRKLYFMFSKESKSIVWVTLFFIFLLGILNTFSVARELGLSFYLCILFCSVFGRNDAKGVLRDEIRVFL